MKTVLVLCALVAVVVCRPQETYNVQYENFNAEELAGNDRLLKNYANCFLNKGPCTAEGKDFKRVIPEAVKTKCAKCTRKQRELIRVVVKAMETKQPELWQELVKKEDPTGEYKADFASFVNSTD